MPPFRRRPLHVRRSRRVVEIPYRPPDEFPADVLVCVTALRPRILVAEKLLHEEIPHHRIDVAVHRIVPPFRRLAVCGRAGVKVVSEELPRRIEHRPVRVQVLRRIHHRLHLEVPGPHGEARNLVHLRGKLEEPAAVDVDGRRVDPRKVLRRMSAVLGIAFPVKDIDAVFSDSDMLAELVEPVVASVQDHFDPR